MWRSVQAAGEKPEFQVAPNRTQTMGEKSPHEGCHPLKVSVALRQGEGIVVVVYQDNDALLMMTGQGVCQDTRGMFNRKTVGAVVHDPFAFKQVLVARNNAADPSLYRLQGLFESLLHNSPQTEGDHRVLVHPLFAQLLVGGHSKTFKKSAAVFCDIKEFRQHGQEQRLSKASWTGKDGYVCSRRAQKKLFDEAVLSA